MSNVLKKILLHYNFNFHSTKYDNNNNKKKSQYSIDETKIMRLIVSTVDCVCCVQFYPVQVVGILDVYTGHSFLGTSYPPGNHSCKKIKVKG